MKGKKYPLYAVLFLCCFLGGRMTAYWKAESRVSVLPSASLAVVIDDFGYGGEGEEEMLALPIALTAAIMPFSDSTEKDAQKVREAKKEILIHLPMESTTGKKEWVGEKGIFCHMEEDAIRDCVAKAYEILPDAVGVNNHMGSAVMEQHMVLQPVLEEVQKNNGIFLDSLTTAESIGKETAEKTGVTYLERDVFLDSTEDVEQVKQNIRQAAEIAKSRGYAVAIGHVGPEGGCVTAQALAEMIPVLEKEGIRFVYLTDLVNRR